MIAEVAESTLPTRHGTFRLVGFRMTSGKEHVALVAGAGENPLVRVHSECLTGDVFGSLRCDCQMQLHTALERIANGGVVVYLRQEGRGIGLFNKVKAYALQDKGLDTVEANEHLGRGADEREYADASVIMKYLQVGKCRLLTNNPEKIKQMRAAGIVVEQVPLVVASSATKYLETKKVKLGHLF